MKRHREVHGTVISGTLLDNYRIRCDVRRSPIDERTTSLQQISAVIHRFIQLLRADAPRRRR